MLAPSLAVPVFAVEKTTEVNNKPTNEGEQQHYQD